MVTSVCLRVVSSLRDLVAISINTTWSVHAVLYNDFSAIVPIVLSVS